jgi:hypothetical protein
MEGTGGIDIKPGKSSTTATAGSTEHDQFHDAKPKTAHAAE